MAHGPRMRIQRFVLPLVLVLLAACGTVREAMDDVRTIQGAVAQRFGPPAKVQIAGGHLLLVMPADTGTSVAPAVLRERARDIALTAYRAYPRKGRLADVDVAYSRPMNDGGAITMTAVFHAGKWTAVQLAALDGVTEATAP